MGLLNWVSLPLGVLLLGVAAAVFFFGTYSQRSHLPGEEETSRLLNVLARYDTWSKTVLLAGRDTCQIRRFSTPCHTHRLDVSCTAAIRPVCHKKYGLVETISNTINRASATKLNLITQFTGIPHEKLQVTGCLTSPPTKKILTAAGLSPMVLLGHVHSSSNPHLSLHCVQHPEWRHGRAMEHPSHVLDWRCRNHSPGILDLLLHRASSEEILRVLQVNPHPRQHCLRCLLLPAL